MSWQDLLVGRQAIFDGRYAVYGYEVLFQSVTEGCSSVEPGVCAPDDAGCHTSIQLGLLDDEVDRFVGDKLMFCDIGEELLHGDPSLSLPPSRTVLEIPTALLTSKHSLARLVPRCERLVQAGFRLALDDFGCGELSDDVAELFAFVKVDSRRHGWEDVVGSMDRYRELGVRMIVQGIDTDEALDPFGAIGVDLFQGNLLAARRLGKGRVLGPSARAKIRLASRVLQPDTDISEVEALVRADPVLCLHLLRLAAIGVEGGFRRTVRTVREALVLVGWRRLQAWVSLLLLNDGSGIAGEPMTSVLTRARMCEILGHQVDGGNGEMAFMAGMLSGMDTLVGAPLEEVLAELPLDAIIRDAVVHRSGPIGRLVSDVTDYELGRRDHAVRSDIGPYALQSAYFDALVWSVEMTGGMAVPPPS